MHEAENDAEEYNGDENESDWPAGCYQCKGVSGCTKGSWFNAHTTGTPHSQTRLYCGQGFEPIVSGCVLFDGDSDVDYWPGSTTDVAPGAYNIGVGGATCKNVRNGATQAAAAFGPSWVVLVCGENDLWGKSVAVTFGRFKDVVAKYTGAGARVLYVGTKPEPGTTSLHDEYREYDNAIKAHAAEVAAGATGAPPPLVMVDSYNGFEDVGNPSSGSSSLYAGDGLHLSARGYALWDAWTAQALNSSGDCLVWRSGLCVAAAATSSPTAAPTTASPTTAALPSEPPVPPPFAPPSTPSPTTASPTSASPTSSLPSTSSPASASPTTSSPSAAAGCTEIKTRFENALCGLCGNVPHFAVGGSTCRGLKDLYKLSACPCGAAQE